MEIEILYQDDYYIAVNKPSGLLVHPYKAECRDREHLMKFVKNQTGLYLYPMHRLDRPVSGVVLFALSSLAVSSLQKMWSTDQVVKEYHCLVRRHIFDPGVFDYELSDDAGIKRPAITRYWPLERFFNTTFVRVEIDTGRQHQIRRHFSRVCHNLVGDTTYGKGVTNNYFREQFDLHRIFLHASSITFPHPFTQERVTITAPFPEELNKTLVGLSNQLLVDEAAQAAD